MKNFLCIFFILFSFLLYSDETDDSIISTITKTKIKIGERITLIIKIRDLHDGKVLWEDMNFSESKTEIIVKKDYYNKKILHFKIIFTFFDPGDYNNLICTIPISTSAGKILYLESDKYNITVENPLTKDEIETLKNIKDPSKIKLKEEKPQAKINFNISFFVKIVFLVILLVIIGMILYYFLYKVIMKKKHSESIIKIPPYPKFLAHLEKISFNKKDDRNIIEKKLSELTEILKELIYEDFTFNAISETTTELLMSLREIDFDSNIADALKKNFDEIDMIKFAKAPVEFSNLNAYIQIIKKLGNKIHNYKLLMISKEEKDENI